MIEAVYLRGALALFYQGRVVTIQCEKSELFEIIEYVERARQVKVRLVAYSR